MLTRVLAAVLLAAPVPADPVRAEMTSVLSSLSVPRAWTLTKGRGVTVAVLDTGVDAAHADLAGSVTTGPDYTRGAGMAAPRRLHGTTMASIIAGHGHGRSGVIGVAPEARLLALRVILERDEPGFAAFNRNARYEGTVARGIRYAADHGADVVNLSLGRSYPTRAEREAVAYAIARGVVVVAAAGNGGAVRGTSPEYSFPASFPGVISVAAVDAAGRHAGFSNRNSAVVVSAPGVRIVGAGPGDRYWIGDGTSPATAFVSGVAALIRSRHPKLAPALVTQAIVAGARPRPRRGYDVGVGFGRVDAFGALAASDRLASSRTGGLGLPESRRFGEPRPVRVMRRDRGLIALYATVCAVAVAGLIVFGVPAVRRTASSKDASRA
ncbi:S8 family serine peptidase [Spirillospora sp. CA-294931]|uniref:S8 family serine peptidase n=1 Tax=Spirillospora sp. CA-294931 TaxID=3240042 RepID=UPI003D8FD5A7